MSHIYGITCPVSSIEVENSLKLILGAAQNRALEAVQIMTLWTY